MNGGKFMKNLSLYVPNLEEYWYEERVLRDPNTMGYNAGYPVTYRGYHYDTGCIDFPKEKWKEKYDKRIKNHLFFAYIKDNDANKFVGFCNYQYNKEENRYECGLLIEAKYRGKGYSKEALNLLCQNAKENGIHELYDVFEINRKNTLKVFEAVGFKIVEKTIYKRFDTFVESVVVRITL